MSVVVAVPSPSVVAGLRVSFASQPETLVQLTFRFDAFDGSAVAAIVRLAPAVMAAVVGFTETLVTRTDAA